ncbi:MAG: ABC transporter substrate-binding protein, partial [Desulfobulbaceae bacterium]|nr:ABC transporter substrate-binding protein [Desulfobulbaceae bacterium]
MRWFVLLFFVFWLFQPFFSIEPQSAEAAEQEVSDSGILVGTSLPLTGHASYLGLGIVTGMNAYFRHVNSQGGIHGRKIKCVAYDDDYNPPLMITNVKRLIDKDRVFALIGLVGTPTTLTVVEQCEKQKIPLLFPFTGAIELRQPVKNYILNLRPSYWDEGAAAVDYFLKQGKRRIAVFYQNDAYGFNGRDGVERRLIKYDLGLAGEASYIRGESDVVNQVQEIKKSNPDVIVMIGTADPCAAFILEAVRQGMKDVLFSNVSFVGGHELAKRLPDCKATVFVTQVFPSVSDTSLPAVREYRQLLQTFFPATEPDQVSLEGFLNAKLFVEALIRSGADDPERERLVRTIEDMHEFDIGIGEKVNFSRTDHQGLDKIYFTRIED